MIEEVFVEVEGFPDYVVSNYGRVVNVKHDFDVEAFRYSRQEHLEYQVLLFKDGALFERQVQDLVAQAFFIDWEQFIKVYHISDDYQDNSIGNLTLSDPHGSDPLD